MVYCIEDLHCLVRTGQEVDILAHEQYIHRRAFSWEDEKEAGGAFRHQLLDRQVVDVV